MSGIEQLAKTIAEMPVAGMVTVVMLAAFALAAFAIHVVGNNGKRP